MAAIAKQVPCYACGQIHVTYRGPYFWKAAPANNSFWKGSRDGVNDGRRVAWNVWAIQECGANASTEAVCTFDGNYHGAKTNAEECVGLHNTALLKRLGLELMPEGVRKIANAPPLAQIGAGCGGAGS